MQKIGRHFISLSLALTFVCRIQFHQLQVICGCKYSFFFFRCLKTILFVLKTILPRTFNLSVIFFFLDCCHRHHSSPEMHGTITGTFKNQIDWIPLNTGSVRPTQGKSWYVSYRKYVRFILL